MYGSNFWSRTRSPRCSSSMPIDAQVNPLPSELTTPPVTKMCLAIASLSMIVFICTAHSKCRSIPCAGRNDDSSLDQNASLHSKRRCMRTWIANRVADSEILRICSWSSPDASDHS